jgi:uncharacterized membrane protein YphA (DoxX/SURF4 family)
MSLARRAARAALAASFISGGIDQIRNPQPKAAPASPIAKPIADRVPQLPNDPESLVKLDGAIKVVGGLALIVGPFARPAALLLAGSLVPTTLAGHRFWETSDPDQKVSDRVEFFKNVSLLGGLLITALDTGGRPSVPWMAGKAAHGAAEVVGDAAGSVGEVVTGAAGALTGVAGAVTSGVRGGGSQPLSKRARKALAKAEKRSGRAARKGGTALGYALGSAQALSGRTLRRADRAAAKAQTQARTWRRTRGPAVADAARIAASVTREGAHTAKEGVVTAKHKLAAAVSR